VYQNTTSQIEKDRMSNLEPLPPNPVFERVVKPNYSLYIILMVVIVMIVILAAVVVYAVFGKPRATAVNKCEPGLCAVTLATGVKRCPPDNSTQLAYDPIFEDCTSANYCQSPKAPCAVNVSNGTLNCGGFCGTGNNTCNCQKAPV
jgi:hypothetical protein